MPEVELIRSLGQGTMATVHLAREPALQRLVAVKALRLELCSDPVAVRRFEREAQSAARISHPNVCTIHRVGRTQKGVPFIVMEYVEGRTLDSLLAAEGQLPLARICALLAQVAAALAAAHGKRVIHRDVRPQNVLVERGSDRVVLTDFGIAAIHESGSAAVTRLTREGEKLGNPDYASPEQRRGEAVTEQTDVYSLALVCVDLLNSARRATTDPGSIGRGAEQDLPVPLHVPVPEALRELIRRCLAADPARRPTAADVRDALERIAADPAATETAASAGALPPETLVDAALGFLAELRRRKVYRVAAAYAAGTFILLEAVDIVGPALRIPDWFFRLLVAVTWGGFPIAVTLAWLFDFTRRGLERTRATDANAAGGQGRVMLVVLPLLGLALSIAAAGVIGWWILSD